MCCSKVRSSHEAAARGDDGGGSAGNVTRSTLQRLKLNSPEAAREMEDEAEYHKLQVRALFVWLLQIAVDSKSLGACRGFANLQFCVSSAKPFKPQMRASEAQRRRQTAQDLGLTSERVSMRKLSALLFACASKRLDRPASGFNKPWMCRW